jgi:hypothetical protein
LKIDVERKEREKEEDLKAVLGVVSVAERMIVY